MKRFLLISLCFFLGSNSSYSSNFELIMDCGRNVVFVGEKLLCQFILMGDADIVEAEVVKFPEFRGFWSENLSLRQGPIPLVPILGPFGLKKQAVIGSYSVHRMTDKKTSQIIPMKVSIRTRESSRLLSPSLGPPVFLLSQSRPINMISLPQVPPTMHHLNFSGAVGEFFITQSEIETTYRQDEPFDLKLTLQGQGNFTEINTLHLSLPENSEVISQRTFTQLSGNGIAKTFELSILLKSPPPESQPLGLFMFFNPVKKKYETLRLPTIKFSKAIDRAQEEIASFHLPAPEEKWTQASSFLKSYYFWISQLFLLIFCLFGALKAWKEEKNKITKGSNQFKRQQIWGNALEAQRTGDSTKFVQLATVIFTELLKEKGDPLKMRFSHYPTKRQLVRSIKHSFTPEQLAPIEALFAHYDNSFSPNKESPLPSQLIAALDESLQKHNKLV